MKETKEEKQKRVSYELCKRPGCLCASYYKSKYCYNHYKLLPKRKKLTNDKERSKNRFRKSLINKYGKSILTDYRELLKITSYLRLKDIAEKYGFTLEYSRQIFSKLFGLSYDKQLKRRNLYRKRFAVKNPISSIRDVGKWYNKKEFCLYDKWSDRLTIDEGPIKGKIGLLKVKCAYCGRYFYPPQGEVSSRFRALSNHGSGECRLYCSKNCKRACPIFNQRYFVKETKQGTSREVQPGLRQLVLERDNYECLKCGAGIYEAQLHCHHIEGVEQNPIESADIDICITLCKKCHLKTHKQIGCKRSDLTRYALCK